MEPRPIESAAPHIWSALSCAQPLLPAATTRLFCLGVTGSLFQSVSTPPLYSDFMALLFPGLRALGIEAVLQPLPDAPRDVIPFLLDENGPWSYLMKDGGRSYSFFQFGGAPVVEEERWDMDSEADSSLTRQDRERIVLQQGVLLGMSVRTCPPTNPPYEKIEWEDTLKQSHSANPEEFRARFSFVLRLRRAATRETRRVSLLAAIRRAVVYHLAFPDLAISDSDADRTQRTAAAQFLSEAVGRQRDPISLRWRQAAEYLEKGDADAAWRRLTDAVLPVLNLPPSILEALAADQDLTDLQIRELTYLARAGNRDIKVFALRRLTRERNRRAICQTLDSFAFYPDPLVRAAAR